MHENVLFAAEANDVPHDQEISGEFQLRDESKLFFHLPFGSRKKIVVALHGIAVRHTFFRAFPQERVHRLPGRYRVHRELVTQIGERVSEARGQFGGVPNRFRQVGKESPHRCRRPQMALIIPFEQPSGLFEPTMIPNTGEHIENLAVVGTSVANAIGRKQGQMYARRDLNRSLNAVLFGRIEMTLHFDKHVAFPKDRNQIFDVEARFCFPASGQRCGQHSLLATRQADKPFGTFGDIIERGCAGSFFLFAQFVPRDQTA